MIQNNNIFKLGLVLLIVFGSIGMVGCKYKEFSLQKFDTGCFIEYPSSYEMGEIDREPDFGASATAMRFSKNGETQDATLEVGVMKPDEEFPSSAALIEYYLVRAQKNQLPGEFKLIERTPINVGGAIGEKIIFQRSSEKIPERISRIYYQACFENNGYIWEIGVSSIIEMANQSQEDFDHLVRSFRFRD
jgi:hypothetical protein